jgi:hypothetical protein
MICVEATRSYSVQGNPPPLIRRQPGSVLTESVSGSGCIKRTQQHGMPYSNVVLIIAFAQDIHVYMGGDNERMLLDDQESSY